ncbi:hypothetical protein L873DRAFT_1806080 [Choiromyces venosus 120613-1]|uniref:Uncharacterized protein n=1 Tax=Choiromyces venosus 120613-1 TaxID=1336337 RepID=A0A3N4JRL6_9PEZI|nr:hypothetical protein L873DRAFT_1806080 [Choiromyces venosus 120613-1]
MKPCLIISTPTTTLVAAGATGNEDSESGNGNTPVDSKIWYMCVFCLLHAGTADSRMMGRRIEQKGVSIFFGTYSTGR